MIRTLYLLAIKKLPVLTASLTIKVNTVIKRLSNHAKYLFLSHSVMESSNIEQMNRNIGFSNHIIDEQIKLFFLQPVNQSITYKKPR